MTTKTKSIAGWSLAMMAAGFAATVPYAASGWTGLLRAGFEAGLVGGLADWFAVTALFRHPLGVPIPHTALLPRNRDKMTTGIISMLENELLNKESIERKIEGIPLAPMLTGQLLVALTEAARNPRVLDMLEQLLRGVDVKQLVPMLRRQLDYALEDVNPGEIVSEALRVLMERGYDGKALDFVLERAQGWILTPEMRAELGRSVMQVVENLNLGGLMQFAVNAFIGYLDEDRVGGLLQSFIWGKLEELKRADDPKREKLLTEVRSSLVRLPEHPSFSGELAGLKDQLLGLLGLDEKIETALERLREQAVAWLRSESFAEQVTGWADRLFAALEANPETMQELESWLKGKISGFIQRNHGKIGTLVKENLDKLDNETLTELIEEKVGRDLQWIRVNGAVCGFLIGLALFGIRAIFS